MTNTATQTQGAQAQTTEQTTTPTTTVKKGKITDTIVSTLQQLPEGQVMTIAELSEKIPQVKRATLQATLSQMVGKNRVVKVVTGNRQPGYKAPGK